MAKKLENLRWRPRWVTHLGCVKGCLDFLNIGVSDAWLFGATGHAFVINIHEVVCPSGPTAWCTEMLFTLGNNIGYVADGVCALKTDGEFAEKQRRAWEEARGALDEDLPCYGWELDVPEYYVIYGYDGDGYYYSGPGCDLGTGPKPWNELGVTQIGVLEMYHLRACQAVDDVTVIKDAFRFALEFSKSPDKWIFPKYRAGLAGYDLWIHALESGDAHPMGVAYNAAVWNECRELAVMFLLEAQGRLGDHLSDLFLEPIRHYAIVAENLKKVSEIFPFHGHKPKHLEDKARVRTAVESLRAAREAEKAGLGALEMILGEL